MVQPPVARADSPADAGPAEKRNRTRDLCRLHALLVYLAARRAGHTTSRRGRCAADREAASGIRDLCRRLGIGGLAAPRRTPYTGLARSPEAIGWSDVGTAV